jgi:hypothetical protein
MSVSWPTPLFRQGLDEDRFDRFFWLHRVFTATRQVLPRGNMIPGKHLAPLSKHIHLICQRLIWTKVEERMDILVTLRSVGAP